MEACIYCWILKHNGQGISCKTKMLLDANYCYRLYLKNSLMVRDQRRDGRICRTYETVSEMLMEDG